MSKFKSLLTDDERAAPLPAVGRRCARCDHEWNLAVEAKTYGDGTKAVGTAPLPLQSPAETQSAHGDVSGEVIAMRGDFDERGVLRCVQSRNFDPDRAAKAKYCSVS